ncbi:DUF2391 family protein [Candidatus Woesearchaeota archaeon]|nr:DUF2391 family protein [Candidatus Woesearchaeota archaeon]
MKRIKQIQHISKEDVFQLIFGALMLGVPAAFTEEIWVLGGSLTWVNYGLLILLSTSLIAVMVFHTGYRIHSIKTFERIYFKRVLLSYGIIFLTCAVFLTMIDRAPWAGETLVAIQRTVVLSVPASISGITADMIN